jgi:hypothetical protein
VQKVIEEELELGNRSCLLLKNHLVLSGKPGHVVA